jgi:exopolysaccharide biosynthesis polyprenyl glycosylphosphotransferase
MRRALLVADLVGLTSAYAVAEVAFGADPASGGNLGVFVELAVFVAALPCWVAAAKLGGLYARDERQTSHSTVDELVHVAAAVTVGTWLFFVGARATGLAELDLDKLLTFWTLSVVFVTIGRIASRAIVRGLHGSYERTVIVGAGYVGQLVAEKLAHHPEYGIELVGFVDLAPRRLPDHLSHLRTLGRPESLYAIAFEHHVQRVLVAYSLTPDDELLPVLRRLRRRGVRIDIVPRFFELIGPGTTIDDIAGLVMMDVPTEGSRHGGDRVKRAVDLVVASIVLALAAPLLLAIAAWVALDSPGPVLYRHRRIGKEGKPFDVLKFRTMRIEYCRGNGYGGTKAEDVFARLLQDEARRAEFERSHKLTDDPRVTRVGSFLRRSSLDELPQLLNVVRGELSLVGPRPITEEELGRYGDSVDALLDVRPGITGYWQINGRSHTDYGERVRLDLAYLHDRSFSLDLKILAKTAQTLRSRSGAC